MPRFGPPTTLRALGLVLAAGLAAGCAANPSRPIKLPADGIDGLKGKSVALVSIRPESLAQAELYVFSPNFNSQALYTKETVLIVDSPVSARFATQWFPPLDVAAIRGAMGGVMKRLAEIETQVHVDRWFTAVFRPALEDQGLRVVSATARNAGQLKRQTAGGDVPRYDVTALPAEPADYALVLEVHAFGVGRSYAPFGVPVSPPWGEAAVIAYLVDLTSHRLLWQDVEIVRERVAGDWDEPAGYPGLTRAVLNSLEKAIDQMFFSLFGRPP